ncbi:hypothetical protein C1N66_00330 [Bacillus cereus]|uniref:Uncharacterized protein n=1 Tax=Bacillus cereus TaxID=1396 RepID=A0AB73USS2_BACCE|nr:hypothetical protein [Lysinibacillus xylanilyticus]QHV47268.1 hypothetical protein C1N66_00330 [Bacillus cereus]
MRNFEKMLKLKNRIGGK